MIGYGTPTTVSSPAAKSSASLNSDFFKETITQHLSFPVDAPWFSSPYISVTASYANMNKIHAKPYMRYKPWIFEPIVDDRDIDVRMREQRGEVDEERRVLVVRLMQRGRWGEVCVCSVRELVGVLESEKEVFEHGPDWWEGFLVLRHVPREMISEYERDEFERLLVISDEGDIRGLNDEVVHLHGFLESTMILILSFRDWQARWVFDMVRDLRLNAKIRFLEFGIDDWDNESDSSQERFGIAKDIIKPF